ncbi:hypothetical protein ACLOJK_033920 [Asimina triloba]
MKSARRILLSKFSKTHHSRRIYYSSAASETVEVGKIESLDDLDFPDYDPTPYDGGYDVAATYGQPLPPSAAICYPPSPHDPNSSTLKGFSYGSLPSPYGNEGADPGPPKSSSSGDAEPSAGLEKQLSPTEDGNSATNGFGDVDIISQADGVTEHEEEESCALGNSTWKTQPQTPDEYCQSSFFSWLFPFEEDENRYRPRDDDDEGWNGGQWKGAAEYLFGFSYPGSERKDLEIYSYAKKHTHEHSSWLHEATAFHQDSQEKKCNWSNSRITDIVPTYHEDYHEEEYPQCNSIPIYSGNYQEKMITDIVPTYYEDYQEEEYPQSKYVIANSIPICNEDYREKEEHSRSNGIGTKIVPFYYEDYQEEEEECTQVKDATTDIVLTSYYEDYEEEEYLRSKYVSTNDVLIPTYNEGYNASYTQSRGIGTEIVPIYYEDYQEEEDYNESKDVITDIALTYYEDYQEEAYV